MKRIYKNPIFTFIIGGVLFGTLGVLASNIDPENIRFRSKTSTWNATTVDEALDDLYRKTTGTLINRIDWNISDIHAERNISTANTAKKIENLSGNYLVVWSSGFSHGSESGVSTYGNSIGISPYDVKMVLENGSCEEIFGKYAEKTAVTAYTGYWKMHNRTYQKIYKCSFTDNGVVKLTFTNGNINTYNSRTDILSAIRID